MSLRSALSRIYDGSPVPVQTRMRMVYGRLPSRLKLGAEFRSYCQDLLRNEWRTREDLSDPLHFDPHFGWKGFIER